MRNIKRVFYIQNTCVVLCYLAIFLFNAQLVLAQTHAKQSSSVKAPVPEIIIQQGHTSAIEYMAISPDRSKLATTSGGNIKIWDLLTGGVLRTTSVEGGGMGSQVVFSQDNRHLATLSGQYTAVILDVQSGKPVRTIRIPQQLSTVGFIPNSPFIALGCPDQSLEIWNWRNGKKIRSVTTHVGWLKELSLSNDGLLLATVADDKNSIEIWNAQTSDLIKTIHANDRIYSAAFSPTGKEIALGVGGFPGAKIGTEIWDITRSKRTKWLAGHEHEVSSLAYSKSGATLTTVDKAGIIRVWDTVQGKLLKTMGKRDFAVSTAVSSDGSLAVVSPHSENAYVYDAIRGKRILEVRGASHVMLGAVACNNGQTLITGGNRIGARFMVGELLFWDMQTGICTGSFQWGYDLGSWGTLSASPDGRYVAAGSDLKAAVWDVPAKRLLATFAPPKDEHKRIMALAISPDGSLLAIGGQKPDPAPKVEENVKFPSTITGFLEIWKVSDHTKLRECVGVNDTVASLVFSRDGAEIIGNGVGTGVAVWDVNTGAIRKQYSGMRDSLAAVSTSDDGNVVVGVGDGETFHVWRRKGAEQPREFRTSLFNTSAVALSSDGAQVVVGGELGTLHLWSVTLGTLIRSFGGNAAYLSSLAYVQKGTAIVSLVPPPPNGGWD